MRYIPLKPQRLYCPHCEETYSLPQNGTIKLYKEIRCPLDNFELVLFSLGNAANAQGKSYPLCPCCYNQPPSFEDLFKERGGEADDDDEEEQEEGGDEPGGEGKQAQQRGGEGEGKGSTGHKPSSRSHAKMGCNQCRHPTCKQSLEFTGICPCPSQVDPSEDSSGNKRGGGGGGRGGRGSGGGGSYGGATVQCRGTLVLDVNSKPNWKLACNECNTLVRFHANIHNITPLTRQSCADCGTRLIFFEFNKSQKSPLPSGAESCTGCLVCDDALNGLTEIVAGRSMHLTLLRQMRFKRGAGGRGRGRGRRGGGGRGKGGDVKMSFADF
jgi:DNA topoisomerase III